MTRRLLVFVLSVLPSLAAAQSNILFQGLLDLEGWKTDTTSTLLRRNGGELGPVVRLRLWSAIEPARGLFLFANVESEAGSGQAFGESGVYTALEQWGVRLARHPSLVLNAGRMVHPLGAFGSRVLSTRNPLIGIPDGYLPVYPLGVMASGERGKFDYRAAAVSLPPTHRDYVPDPDHALRPVLSLGVTPIQGFRIGVTATDGPYLNNELTSSQLDGKGWRSYRQRIAAADLQFGVGHFDLRSEVVATEYEVPRSGRINGQAAYVEASQTLTPRVFVAARAEFNHYPFIRAISDTDWISRRTDFKAVELGGGFRFGANTTLKASYRRDDWKVTAANAGFVRPGGQAFAIQFSRRFDVMEWVSRLP